MSRNDASRGPTSKVDPSQHPPVIQPPRSFRRTMGKGLRFLAALYRSFSPRSPLEGAVAVGAVVVLGAALVLALTVPQVFSGLESEGEAVVGPASPDRVEAPAPREACFAELEDTARFLWWEWPVAATAIEVGCGGESHELAGRFQEHYRNFYAPAQTGGVEWIEVVAGQVSVGMRIEGEQCVFVHVPGTPATECAAGSSVGLLQSGLAVE